VTVTGTVTAWPGSVAASAVGRAGEAGQAAGLPASSLEVFRVTEVTIKLEMKVNSLKFNLKFKFRVRRHEST
jgi:hypothetical protein